MWQFSLNCVIQARKDFPRKLLLIAAAFPPSFLSSRFKVFHRHHAYITKSTAVKKKNQSTLPPPPAPSPRCCFPRRRRVQRADHVRLVPEGGREALLPQHGQRAEELLQREVLRRLPPGLLQEEQGNTPLPLPPFPPPALPFLLLFLLPQQL